METNTILIGLAGVIAAATPVVFATIGETITEKSGVTNLSVNGTIILSAMIGFAVATTTTEFDPGVYCRCFGWSCCGRPCCICQYYT